LTVGEAIFFSTNSNSPIVRLYEVWVNRSSIPGVQGSSRPCRRLGCRLFSRFTGLPKRFNGRELSVTVTRTNGLVLSSYRSDQPRRIPYTPSPHTINHPTMDPSAPCYTIVNDDSLDGMSGAHGTPTSMELRNALQKGSDEVKLDTMRRIIVDTLNGHNHVSRLRSSVGELVLKCCGRRRCSCRLSNTSSPRATNKSRRSSISTGSESRPPETCERSLTRCVEFAPSWMNKESSSRK
jgi:hypothetical protein